MRRIYLCSWSGISPSVLWFISSQPYRGRTSSGMATSPTLGHPRKRKYWLWPVDPRAAEASGWLCRDRLMSIQPHYWCGPFLPKSRCPWAQESHLGSIEELSVWWMASVSGKGLMWNQDPGLSYWLASERILIFLFPLPPTCSSHLNL